MSEFVLRCIHTVKEQGITILDLRNCSLTELPNEIGGLTWLKKLCLKDNKIIDISPLSSLSNLVELDIQNNKITDTTSLSMLSDLNHLEAQDNEISDLSPLRKLLKLTKLDIHNNKVINISHLTSLSKLRDLDMHDNQIEDISSLMSLSNLKILNIRNNRIKNISSLARLSALMELFIDNNQIDNIEALNGLARLIKLTLNENNITDVTLGSLLNLKILSLSNNKIKNIDSISSLLNLKLLELSNNKITDITPLSSMSNLVELNISNNKLIDINSLSSLPKLERLDLSNNQLLEVDSCFLPPNLKKLDVRGNKIHSLKPLLEIIDKKHSISFGNNPLEHPPMSIAEQGDYEIFTYFRNLEEQGAEKLNEAKLIIVGEPEAGKTSLMKKLLNPDYKIPQAEDSTLGIQVSEGWQFPLTDANDTTFSANIWDFGGQQIQYMTHQFFLTPGAVYVLVSANDRKETIANFRYWFKIIHLLGEEKGVYSPVLVIQNDKNGQFIHQFDEVEYQRNYPELHISKRTLNLGDNGIEFQALRAEIQRMLTTLPHVNDARPARWGEIRATLRTLTKECNHINFAEYAAICSEHQVKDEPSQMLLSYYLHRLGSLLHFADDPTLCDFIILNPQWAVDAVYSVLNDNSIAQADGHFTLDKLASIWCGKYDTIEQGKLLNLMKRDNFEICYELECAKNTFIAPQLLNERRPFYEWNNTDTLKFRFQYKFMPEGIITRLIVRLNDLISKGEEYDLVWRKGMVLKRNGCCAQVQEEENRDGLKVIDIAVTGKLSERKYLLRTIRDEVEKLHRKWFRNIQAEQMIPCHCEVCNRTTEPTYFAFDELQQYLDEGESNIICRNERIKRISVRPLLEGVFELDETEQMNYRRERFMSGDHYNIHVEQGAQLIWGNDNTQKSHSDNTTTTITADQRQIISTVLDEMLEHKLPKDITKAVVKMQDVADADKEKPTQETQSRLGKFYDGMKKLAGFTDDVNKIGGFVAKHQDDIGTVLTSIQNAI